MYTIAYFSKYNIEGGLGAGSSVLWYILNEKLCNDVVIYLPLCGFSLKIKKNVCLLYSRLTLDVFSKDFNGTEHHPYLFGYDCYSYEVSEKRC